MVDESTINCLRESEVDTVEIALRKRMEDLISQGNIEQAEVVEDTISSLDRVPVCEGERLNHVHFESMMRDRARYL